MLPKTLVHRDSQDLAAVCVSAPPAVSMHSRERTGTARKGGLLLPRMADAECQTNPAAIDTASTSYS